MRRLYALSLVVAVAAIAHARPLGAQGAGNIQGHVFGPQNKPIANATVQVTGTQFRARTDAKGAYQLDSVPAGVVQVEARYIGYKPRAVAGLRIQVNQTITGLDFALEAAPITLREITPGSGSVGPGGMLLRFQLIRPIPTRTTDKALMPIDSVLHDLFQWPGYQLLSQSAVILDMPMPVIWGGTGASSSTQTMLNVEGNSYDLSVRADTTDMAPQRIKLTVSLVALSHVAATKSTVTSQLDRKTVLSTTVTVNFGRTVVLGSTQPGGGRGGLNGTLILTVSPTLRSPTQ